MENELEFENEISEETETTQEQQDFGTEESVNQEPAEQVSKSLFDEHELTKKGFWKTHDDVIKGYDYLNSRYKPVETLLGQRGIKDVDRLTEILKEHDRYSDPNSEINQTYSSIMNLLEHPTYGQQFQQFVHNIVENEEKQNYGFALTPEMRQQQAELAELKQWRQQQEQKTQETQFMQTLDSVEAKIQEFMKSKGLELSQDDLVEHFVHCRDNNIGINNVYDSFVSRNLDKILGNIQTKASAAVTQNISKNAKSAVASGSRNIPSDDKVPTTLRGLGEAMQKVLYN